MHEYLVLSQAGSKKYNGLNIHYKITWKITVIVDNFLSSAILKTCFYTYFIYKHV